MQTTVAGCSKELASELCLSQLLFAAFFILDTKPNVFFGYYKHGTTFFQSFIHCFDNKIDYVAVHAVLSGF
jgi:hypothetical protein